MDYDEENRLAKTAQRMDPQTEEQASSDSRNHHAPEPSRPPHLVHATTFTGRSNYPSSVAPGDVRRSTAVQAPKPAAACKTTHSAASSWKPINRKPVERNEGPPATNTGVRSRSNTEGGPSDGLLAPPPQDNRGQATSSTSVLFNQASRSLTCLTQGVNDVDIQEHTESPPPYADPPTNSGQLGDVKQRNTLGDLGINGERPDAIYLVRENRLDLLRRMLEQGFVINDIDSTTKRTAIMEAANLRRIGAARILIRSGCRLHLKDIDGWSALHFASSQGDVEMCRMLLDAGAQLDEYSNSGETPLLLAARGGHTDVVLCLLNSWAAQMSSGTSLLNGFLEASKSGNVRTAEVFIERGINPKKIQDSWRPVVYAG